MARMKSKNQLVETDVRELIREYWETLGPGNDREQSSLPPEIKRSHQGAAKRNRV